MVRGSAVFKKRNVRIDALGQLHVHNPLSNIIISLVNNKGQVISWSLAGKMGFHGSKKNAPYVAQMVAEDCPKMAFNPGPRKVKAFVKGPGNSCKSVIHTVNAAGIQVTEIVDVIPLPYNNCRPPERRRV